ncbi:MAG TPA: hypothetical protein VH639_27650 [Bryobacteraceae bacterium]
MTLTTEFDDVTNEEPTVFTVVHPLDDQPEEKIDTEHLPPMQMTKTVRVCLFAPRGYLLLIFGLLIFRVLQLAEVVRG